MVGGNNYPAFQQVPPPWLNRLWSRPFYRGRALGSLSILDFGKGRFALDPRYIWGCNFSIRKSVLLDAGGFHPDAFPDASLKYRGDGESHVSRFVRNCGATAIFDSDASVHHLVPKDRMTKEYFARRYFAQGISYSYSSIRAAHGEPGISHQLGNLARRTRNAFTRTLQETTNLIRHKDDELPTLMGSFHRSYWDGYDFHMQSVRRDRALLDWVLKVDYL
jgi:glucosyl-dolichyl phosphate glucuronosyltransferase